MKSSTVRGTPINKIDNPGFTASKPGGMNGTVNTHFQGDQSQQPQAGSGTPYASRNGNPDQARRVAEGGSPKGGVVLSENGINMNAPESNGNGVVLDGVTKEKDYTPWNEPAMDSPVPTGAQRPLESSMNIINAMVSGNGKDYSGSKVIPDNLMETGGVMSRGMVGTSKPGNDERELTRDDTI